jgi:hypothetical protein
MMVFGSFFPESVKDVAKIADGNINGRAIFG